MDVDALIALWRQYARANRTRSELDERNGDLFGARLLRVRGEVRQAAAAVLEQFRHDPSAAARNMHQRARELRQHHWPFAAFDEVALRYTGARTWQDCARTLDPSLAEVQPKLHD